MEILRFLTLPSLRRTLTVGVLLLFCSSGSLQAAPVQLPEHKIKAGLIYNFIKYTHWPTHAFSAPDSPIQVCLFGGDALNGALNPLQGRTAQMHTINIRKINNPASLKACHLAFIHQSKEENLDTIWENTKGVPILMISDIYNFSQKGGMVEFSNPNEKRIHLYLNEGVIQKAGLSVGEPIRKLAESR